MNTRPADNSITAYDVLKTLGVITMIIDHIGLYLWQDAEMLRVIGRLSAPIWFFLIGFARARDVPFSWVFWLSIDLMVTAAVGLAVKPNILLTIIIVRLTLDAIAPLLYPRSRFTAALFMFCVAMMPVVNPFMEYGSLAWMLAAIGYWVRQDGMSGLSWIAAVLFAYFAVEALRFDFSEAALMVLAGGLMCVACVILTFNPQARISTHNHITAVLYRLSGRYSLVIYALHLIAIKIIWFFV